MYDCYNYPPGADNSDAPWNQTDPPEMEYDVRASIVINKEAVVATDKVVYDNGDWDLRSDVSVSELWADNYIDIPTLLGELVKYIDKELEDSIPSSRKMKLQRMKESAQGWYIVDGEYDII